MRRIRLLTRLSCFAVVVAVTVMTSSSEAGAQNSVTNVLQNNNARKQHVTGRRDLEPGTLLVVVSGAADPNVPFLTDPLRSNGKSFEAVLDESFTKIEKALATLGIVTNVFSNNRFVSARWFETTPFIFAVKGLKDDEIQVLRNSPGIVSVSEPASQLMLLDDIGAVSAPPLSPSLNALINKNQLSLESAGGAQITDVDGQKLSSKPDIDIDILGAWQNTIGRDDVVIAIIDDGFDLADPALRTNLYINKKESPCNNLDDDKNGFTDDYSGYNSFEETGCSEYLTDTWGHGSHVAQIAVAGPKTSSGTVTGVAPGAKLLPIRAAKNSASKAYRASWLEGAYSYVLNAKKSGVPIRVLNLSLSSDGGQTSNQARLLAEIAAANITIVAAAGNDGSNNDTIPVYPANFPIDGLISVANVTPAGSLHFSSNFGEKTVTTAAPGTVIYAAGKYRTGTSMSAAHVSGIAALMYSANPLLTPKEVKKIILDTTKLPSLNLPTQSKGIVSAAASVNRARETVVSGLVSYGQTGLGGAVVTLTTPNAAFTTQTDAKGYFFLLRPAIGTPFTLSFTKANLTFGGEMKFPNATVSPLPTLKVTATMDAYPTRAAGLAGR